MVHKISCYTSLLIGKSWTMTESQNRKYEKERFNHKKYIKPKLKLNYINLNTQYIE